MRPRLAPCVAAALLAVAATASAQQPAPPPPAFAAPNLSEKGVRSMAATCATCHGTNGRTVAGSPVGSLAGRPRDETLSSLTQFKEGKKPATIMHQIAKGYSDAELAALSDYFSKLPR